MHLIIYISDYIPSASSLEDDLLNICKASKKNNPEFGITGVLFYHNGNFLQAIEGEKFKLEGLMSLLSEDKRHSNITRIVDKPIEERTFQSWNMDVFNLDDYVKIDRKKVMQFKEIFSSQCKMDTDLFISVLKEYCEDPSLRSVY